MGFGRGVSHVGHVELTKQRKVFVAVLGLCGIALVVDKAFLGGGVTGPSSAAAAGGEAAAVASASKPAGDRTPAKPKAGMIESPMASLARRIARLPVEGAGASDAFSPPAAWPTTEEVRQAAAASDQAPTKTNRAGYRLTSVGRDTAVVVITTAPKDNNTRFLRLGEESDGMKLVGVHVARAGDRDDKTTATIEVAGERFELELFEAKRGVKPKASSRVEPSRMSLPKP